MAETQAPFAPSRRASLCFVVACAALSCTTPSDLEATDALAQRATGYCRTTNAALPQPVTAFSSDGCSRFIDASWDLHCCVEHDIKYWCGGSPEQRQAADRVFGECVSERAGAVVGKGMEMGVRVGGHPMWPASYRWGYGHAFTGRYPDEP